MKGTVVNARNQEFDVYVGRACPRGKNPKCHAASIFSNPFRVGVEAVDRTEAIEKFAALMRIRLLLGNPLTDGGFAKGVAPDGTVLNMPIPASAWRDYLLQLEGKRLGCWCHPLPCHGNVLLQLIGDIRAGRLE